MIDLTQFIASMNNLLATVADRLAGKQKTILVLQGRDPTNTEGVDGDICIVIET